jgi:hypothetical protein
MDQPVVKIFTSSDVPRLRYIASLLLEDILGLDCEVVTDKRKLGKNPVINYSDIPIKGSFHIHPDILLFEDHIAPLELQVSEWNGLPVFFQSPEGYDLPFDILAASFFLVSRYEEYLSYQPDQHGRFSAHSSFSFRNGFLGRPVIDLWVKEWSRLLVKKNPDLVFRKNQFSSLVTVDVDQPFKYLGKNILKNIGGFLKEIGRKESQTSGRYRTLAKGEKDPWDVFDYILETIADNSSDAKFFIPVGNRSELDRNPAWNNEDYRKLIRKLAGKYPVGLHPSAGASINVERLTAEKERLEKIISADIKFSRFHYLKMKLPDSYNNLIAAGVKDDYTMGYHDEPGFRAGIARPFCFYDLSREKRTDLRIYPFQVMDATLYQYKKQKPDEAAETVYRMVSETREAGGLFISIWHNTSLLETGEWIEWRRLFKTLLSSSK